MQIHGTHKGARGVGGGGGGRLARIQQKILSCTCQIKRTRIDLSSQFIIIIHQVKVTPYGCLIMYHLDTGCGK